MTINISNQKGLVNRNINTSTYNETEKKDPWFRKLLTEKLLWFLGTIMLAVILALLGLNYF